MLASCHHICHWCLCPEFKSWYSILGRWQYVVRLLDMHGKVAWWLRFHLCMLGLEEYCASVDNCRWGWKWASDYRTLHSSKVRFLPFNSCTRTSVCSVGTWSFSAVSFCQQLSQWIVCALLCTVDVVFSWILICSWFLSLNSCCLTVNETVGHIRDMLMVATNLWINTFSIYCLFLLM